MARLLKRTLVQKGLYFTEKLSRSGEGGALLALCYVTSIKPKGTLSLSVEKRITALH